MGTFVFGSVAFISFVSFMLVSIAKGLVSPRTVVADEEVSAVTTVASGISRPLSAPLGKPGVTRGALRRGANVPTTAPSKDD